MLLKWISQLQKHINERVDSFGQQYVLFGIFGAINYPLFYLIWIFFASQTYENIYLRSTATLLCIPLIFHQWWPKRLVAWKPFYWYITLLLCLPFFFTFMLLKNQEANVWLMSTTVVMLWLMLLVDALSFLILLVMGVALAVVIFYVFGNVLVHRSDFSGLIIQFFSSLAVVLLFARQKDRLYERRLRIKAEASSRAKTEFISNMSHDIRTPLSGMLGMLDIVLSKIENPSVIEYLNNFKEATQQLLEFLNQILDMAMVDHEKMVIEHEPIDLHGLLYDLSGLISSLLYSKQLTYRVDMTNEVPAQFIGDKTKLLRSLLNIIGNAIKFTKRGGVTLKIYVVDDDHHTQRLRFSVIDTGIGIPQDKISMIFNQFEKLHSSYQGKFCGAGLGLTISQRFIEAMGGTINVYSQEGRGSTFNITLPLVQPITSVSSTTLSDQQSLLKKENKHILVVEDDPFAQQIARHRFSELGWTVTMVEYGHEAITLCQQHHYDLILMDIGLPDMTGFEASTQIKTQADSKNQHTPVVALTAHVNDDKRTRAQSNGLEKILNKPLNDDICTYLRSLL